MIKQNEINQILQSKYLIKRALLGAGMALVMVSLFLVRELDEMWSLLPVTAVTLAGAFGGVFYHIADHLRQQKGWNKILINIFCALVYLAALYMSLVLALAITGHWD